MNELNDLRSLLYEAILELGYVQSVENCHSGLCATSLGNDIIERGMKLLRVKDLSAEKWSGARVEGQ